MIKEAVSIPHVNQERGTNTDKCVSEESGWACCLRIRESELLERAEKGRVEVSVLCLLLGRGRIL